MALPACHRERARKVISRRTFPSGRLHGKRSRSPSRLRILGPAATPSAVGPFHALQPERCVATICGLALKGRSDTLTGQI